jgi:hypothetical protein
VARADLARYMVSPEVETEYKAALRALLVKALPLLPTEEQSIYMSVDYRKARHIHPWYRDEGEECEWVIPEGLVVTEIERDEFAGTDVSSDLKTSLVAEGVNCKCGQLTNETIRVDATFSEVLEQVVGGPQAKTETL